jgi:hypothetical protein
MKEPYMPPQVSPNSSWNFNQIRLRRIFWIRTIWISVAGVIIPPMIGLVGTVFGMRKAFGELGSSGIGGPAALSGHIGEVLVYTASGLIISVVAFIVLVGALIRFFTLPKAPDPTP